MSFIKVMQYIISITFISLMKVMIKATPLKT